MNFKKFISGVSALTIAASAFAGMAVTANAADGGSHYGFTWDATNAGSGYLKFQTVTLKEVSKENTVQVVNNGSANNAATGTAELTYSKSAVVEGYVYIDGGVLRDASQDKSVELQSSTGTSLAKVSMANTGEMNAVTAMGTARSTITTPELDTWVYLKAEFDYENQLMDLTVGSDKAEDIAIGANKFGKIKINSGRVNSKWTSVYLGALSYTGENLPNTYSLTTNPYSKVTVDGNVLYSKADGTVNAAGLTLNGGESITVEKNGYTTQNGTVDLTNGNAFRLVPTDPTVSYYEDFAYATTANVGESTMTISNGNLVPILGTVNTKTGSFALPNIDMSNKLVTINVSVGAKTDENDYTYVRMYLDGTTAGNGTAYATYNNTNGQNWRLTGVGYSDKISSGYHDVQFVSGRDNNAGHLFMYVDGKLYNNVQGSFNTRTVTGLSFETNKGRGANSISISSIKVSNKPTEATVTGGGVAGSYIIGSTVKLGESSTGTWSDGTTTYASGEEYTVSGNVTFTEYAPPTTVAELVEDNITDDEGYDGDDASDAVYSVFEATVTAGTNAIENVVFTLNGGAMSTNPWSTGILASGNAVFALIVPMASSAVTDITAVIDNVPYVAFN